MLRQSKIILLLSSILGFLLLLPTLTLACGGFFCTTTPIDQSAERIIFAVNSAEGTITAIVGIGYTGAAEDFSWVVPVPSPPVLDVAETISLDILQADTNVRFTEPTNYCDVLLWSNGGLGGGGDGFLEQGHVGPYDYAIIRNENPGEMIAWLRDNGYRITPEMEPLIAVYVEEGMYFLAMKLSQEAEVGDIQPVVMTYESDHPMIPIRLTAVAAVENMPIFTWIFADRQYVPENYANPRPDFSRFRGASQIREVFSFAFAPNGEYIRELARIQGEYDGLAFVTEYAMPSRNLADSAQDDPLLARLIEAHPHVTRLRAQMSPEQMTVDPTFIPAPGAHNVSNRIDLSAHVDPLHYWGCSSRSLRSEASESLLTAYTRIDEWNIHIGYPETWTISEWTAEAVSVEPTTVRVFAPEPVDADTIRAFFAGDETPPMLVATSFALLEPVEWNYDPRLLLLNLGGLPGDTREQESQLWRPETRYHLYQSVDGEYTPGTVALNLLTTRDDWSGNGRLYEAMLTYANSYQYYTHAELRHTLFLNNPPYYADETLPAVVIGYPEGWGERLADDEVVVIAPEGMAGNPAAPMARYMRWRDFVPVDNEECTAEVVLNIIGERYGLSEADIQSLPVETTENGDNYYVCGAIHAPLSEGLIAYNQDGRSGYVTIKGEYLIELSAAEADFGQYAAQLHTLAEGVIPIPAPFA